VNVIFDHNIDKLKITFDGCGTTKGWGVRNVEIHKCNKEE